MGKRAEAMKDATQRSRVRQMIEAGYSVAKIMKALGTSYVHTARLVEQEREALTRADPT